MIYEVIIIGGGPSGVAASIQLKRSGIEHLLFEQNSLGGLLKDANLVENYPGFPDGISGRDLVDLMKKQLLNTGVILKKAKVEKIDFKEGKFSIITKDETVQSKIVIIATGTKPKKLGSVLNEASSKIYHEISPLLQIKNQKIGVVGGGDLGFDYALNLAKNNEVTILNRGKQHKCLNLLSERVKKNPKITLINDFEISNVSCKFDELFVRYNKHGE